MTRYNDQAQLWPQSPTGGTDINPTSQLRTLRQTEVRARDATKVHVMSEPESCGECEQGACSLGKVFILCKLEDLSAFPQTHVEKQLGVVVCTCNLSPELAGIGKSVGFGGEPARFTWQVPGQGECRFQKQKKANNSQRRAPLKVDLWPSQAHAQICMGMYMIIHKHTPKKARHNEGVFLQMHRADK